MIELLQYPYLVLALLHLFFAVIPYVFFPAKRTIMLLGGLLILPPSFMAVYCEETYWNAKRTLGFVMFGLAGIEDVLFTFAIGSFVAFWAAIIFKFNFDKTTDKKIFFQRYLFVAILGLIFLAVFGILGVDMMNSAIILQILISVILCIMNRAAINLSLIIAFVYTVYYCLLLKFIYLIYPHFKNYWNGKFIWYGKFSDIPIEEIVWVFTVTVLWVQLLLYYLNIKVLPQKHYLPDFLKRISAS